MRRPTILPDCGSGAAHIRWPGFALDRFDPFGLGDTELDPVRRIAHQARRDEIRIAQPEHVGEGLAEGPFQRPVVRRAGEESGERGLQCAGPALIDFLPPPLDFSKRLSNFVSTTNSEVCLPLRASGDDP